MNPDFLVGVAFALAGLALVFFGRPLSIRYNAWTSRLRERHPNFNPPPAPEWRARNTKIDRAIQGSRPGLHFQSDTDSLIASERFAPPMTHRSRSDENFS